MVAMLFNKVTTVMYLVFFANIIIYLLPIHSTAQLIITTVILAISLGWAGVQFSQWMLQRFETNEKE